MQKEMKSIIRQAFIFFVLLMLAIVGTALIFFPDRVEDLSLNLISEITGTIWVIFCLDRLLNLREEVRRLPTKCLWCSRLLDMNDALLVSIVPESFCETSDKIYQFQNSGLVAIPRLELLKIRDHHRLYSEVKKKFDGQGAIDIIASLRLAEERLGKIIEQSASTFDNQEIILLLNFDHVLEGCLERLTTSDLDNEMSLENVVNNLALVINYAIEVKIWLQKMLDDNFALVPSDHIE
jgi:hypothetical protein